MQTKLDMYIFSQIESIRFYILASQPICLKGVAIIKRDICVGSPNDTIWINKLVYYEVFSDMAAARVREREIKGWKLEKKIKLIQSINPKWEDLYMGLKGDPSALQPALSKAKGPQDDPLILEKTPRGVSLVETIIGILIIGIVFFGLLATFTGAFTNAVRDEIITTAASLARGEMERVTGLSFSDIVDEHRGSPVSFGGDFTNYSWQIRVDAVPAAIASDPDMENHKQVEARVTNTLIGDVSLKTIITNN